MLFIDYRWKAVYLAGCVLIAGCQSVSDRRDIRPAPPTGLSAAASPSSCISSPYHTLPDCNTVAAAEPVAPEIRQLTALEQLGRALHPPGHGPDLDAGPQPNPLPSCANQDGPAVSAASSTEVSAGGGSPRVSDDAITTFGHAPDYSWLIGELQFVHQRNVWKLRYAPVDTEDPYGGAVTLTNSNGTASYRVGQVVRVEGQLVDPDSHVPSPSYRVRSLKTIRQP